VGGVIVNREQFQPGRGGGHDPSEKLGRDNEDSANTSKNTDQVETGGHGEVE